MSKNMATEDLFLLQSCFMWDSSWVMWSMVLHPLLKPACSLLIRHLDSRNHWKRLERIRSIILHRQEAREMGRYKKESSAGLPGLRRGNDDGLFPLRRDKRVI